MIKNVMLSIIYIATLVSADWDGNCGAKGDQCDFFMQCCVPYKCLKMALNPMHICKDDRE